MEQTAPRFHALDGLRGIAALVVVFYHIGWTNHLTTYLFFRNGYLAVDLFFILSGLVIASNYAHRIRSGDAMVGFLRLRFFRLYPLHLVVLALFVVLEIVKLIAVRQFGATPGIDAPFSGQNSFAVLSTNILLIQAWHLFPFYSFNGPSWSISCEMAAYLFFAIAARAGAISAHVFHLVSVAFSIACYVWLADIFHEPAAAVLWGVPRALAGFMLGVGIWRYLPTRRMMMSEAACSVMQMVLLAIVAGIMSCLRGAIAVWVIPFFAMLIASLQSDRGIVARALLAKPFQVMGRWSYSIYMIHSLVLVTLGIVLKRVLNWSIPVADAPAGPGMSLDVWAGDTLVVGVLLLILTLAAAGFRFIEEPGRKYGRRTSSL